MLCCVYIMENFKVRYARFQKVKLIYDRTMTNARTFAKKHRKTALAMCLFVVTTLVAFISQEKHYYYPKIFLCTALMWILSKCFEQLFYCQKQVESTMPSYIGNYCLRGDYASAFAYYNKYLKRILPGLHARIESYQIQCLEDKSLSIDKNAIFSKKMFILIPDSSKVDYNLICDADSDMIHHGDMLLRERDETGHEDRNYAISIYNIKGTNYYCAAEFAAPLSAFYQMHHNKSIDEDALKVLIYSFSEYLKEIIHLHRDKLQNASEILFYKDNGPSNYISQSIIKIIQMQLIKDAP